MRVMDCASPPEMFQLGERLGRVAPPGTVLALVGDLGAGKTVLVQGLACGLGVTSVVASPTFVLLMLYETGRLPLVHADLYRIGCAEEVEGLGLLECFESQGVVAVEWADRAMEVFPSDHLLVEISWVPGAPEGRRVVLQATGPRHEDLLEAALG